ncbi:MAG: hypothetical protein HC819_04055 [Cyclobacteriaceae bacterium]|nr:hypothetical protein [Cyclobacteriaceae bacterium]
MNIFATIEEAIAYKEVTYYTIRFEHEKNSEFEKFILKHGSDKTIHNEFNDLIALLKRLGEEIGAKERYFSRKEKKAEALPPKWNNLLPKERRLHVKFQHNLRLYCMRISDEIVFLFNGGVKTPGPITAQECKIVRKYFEMANKLVEVIEEAIKENNIVLSGIKLEIEKDFELMI